MSSDANQPLPLRRRIDVKCDQFEAAWTAGNQQRIEDVLQQEPSDAQTALLEELLHMELELRRAAGQQPSEAEYRARFPALQAVVTKVFDVADREGVGHEPQLLSATRLRIIREHKKGGLGIVSVAMDESLNREVALKEIQLSFANHRESRERFEREATITGQLEHPNIVPVYGTGNYPDGRPFYAMRFIKGDSLKDAITAYHALNASPDNAGQRRLAFRQLLGRFQDACHAVAYAHSRHVLHRDLKPGNIMLGDYGETLVVDWGLAKMLRTPVPDSGAPYSGAPDSGAPDSGAPDSGAPDRTADSPEQVRDPVRSALQTREGSRVGTPAYMSPEQAAGAVEQLGIATDVYSLGATLYALLTDQPPVTGSSTQEVLERVKSGDWPAPRSIKPGVPPSLEAICLKAMAFQPADRYATATALAQDIERYLAHERTEAGGESLGERLTRWQRRYPGLLTGLAVTMLVMLLAVVLLSGLAWALSSALTAARVATEAQDVALAEKQAALDTARQATAQAREAERMTRAEAARREAIRLEQLANRGDWKTVLEIVDSQLLEAHADRLQCELLRLEALNALGQSARLRQAVDTLSQRADLGRYRGQLLLWKAETNWTLMEGPSAVHVQEALRAGLPPAEEAYARSLVARTVPESIELLLQCVAGNPYHPRANRMLCANRIVSGMREGEQRAVGLAQLFPDDPNYPFLLALAATFSRDEAALADHLASMRAVASPDFTDNAERILQLVDDILDVGTDGGLDALGKLAVSCLGFTTKWRQLSSGVETSGRGSVPDLPPQLFRAPMKVGQGMLKWNSSNLLGGFFGASANGIEDVREGAEILPIATFLTLYGKMLSKAGRRDEAIEVLERAYHAPIVFPEIRRYTLIFLSEPYFVRYLSDLESESGKKDAERGYELMAELLDMEDQPDYVLKSCDQFLHLDERTRLKAHHCLERAHERAPDQHWITALLARSHLRQGNCWRALTLAESVLAANPGDSIARQVRSEARAAMHGL